MRIPVKHRKISINETKSFLCVEEGEYYMDCPGGLLMTEDEWWENHDESDWIPIFDPQKQQ